MPDKEHTHSASESESQAPWPQAGVVHERLEAVLGNDREPQPGDGVDRIA